MAVSGGWRLDITGPKMSIINLKIKRNSATKLTSKLSISVQWILRIVTQKIRYHIALAFHLYLTATPKLGLSNIITIQN